MTAPALALPALPSERFVEMEGTGAQHTHPGAGAAPPTCRLADPGSQAAPLPGRQHGHPLDVARPERHAVDLDGPSHDGGMGEQDAVVPHAEVLAADGVIPVVVVEA